MASDFVIGALGDSITYGAGVPESRTWAALLQRHLQREFGPTVSVINGAVRASSADFAALCWDAIWQRAWRGQGAPPRVSLAIIDYSFTSSPSQTAALIDRCRALDIPVVATLYCSHHDWHVAWQAHDAERRGAWRWPGRKASRNRTAPLVRDSERAAFVFHAGQHYISKSSSARVAAQKAALAVFEMGATNATPTSTPRTFSPRQGEVDAAGSAKRWAGDLQQQQGGSNDDPIGWLPPEWASYARSLLRRLHSTRDHAPNSARPRNALVSDPFERRAAALSVLLHKVIGSRGRGRRSASRWFARPSANGSAEHLAPKGARGYPSGEALENLSVGLLDAPVTVRGAQERWATAITSVARAQCWHGHSALVRMLRARRVPFVSNAPALAFDARVALLDDRHPSELGHRLIADALHSLLINISRECATRATGNAAAGPSLDCLRKAKRPAQLPAGASSFKVGQTCYLGRALNATVIANRGFRYASLHDGRTPGLIADRAGAECVLRCVSSSALRAGFLSVNLERGHRNVGAAELTCLPPCACAAATFDAHAVQRYTFSQRAPPRWAVLGTDFTCDVRVRVTTLSAGRIMVHALTFSAALPGNRSVDTNTLYSLLGR